MEVPVPPKREVLIEAEVRGRATQDRVQWGQVLRARQELEGSVLIPKTLTERSCSTEFLPSVSSSVRGSSTVLRRRRATI